MNETPEKRPDSNDDPEAKTRVLTDRKLMLEAEEIKQRLRGDEHADRKLILEAKEIEQRLRGDAHVMLPLMKALVAGFVAAGLLVVWIIAYLQPILKKEVELSRLDIKIRQKLNTLDSIRVDSLFKDYEKRNNSLNERLSASFAKITQLQTQLARRKDANSRSFSTPGISSERRKELTKQKVEISQAQLEAAGQKQDISKMLLTGAAWRFSHDNIVMGEIAFIPGGRLRWWDTNNVNPDDDFWSLSGDSIKIEINDGFTKYAGELSSRGSSITGTATNLLGNKWTWSAARVVQ